MYTIRQHMLTSLQTPTIIMMQKVNFSVTEQLRLSVFP